MSLKALIKKYRHIWVLLYGVIYMEWFAYLERTVTKNYHIIHTRIDDKIPFIEYFIIPYMLWFIFVAITLTYFFFTSVKDYYKMCLFLFSGMTIFLIISTIFPNGHNLRPEVFERDNIFVHMVQFLYSVDTPTNICPSIHVYNSIGTYIAITKSGRLKNKKQITIPAFFLTISICASTVFLKQHSIVDVIAAVVIAVILYSLVYGPIFHFQERKDFSEQYNNI